MNLLHRYKQIKTTRYFFIAKKLFFVLIGIFLSFIIIDIIFPVKINTSYSTIVLEKDSTLIQAFLTKDDKWRMYTTIDEITPQLKKTLIYKEDKYFYYHFGINPFAIIRAGIKNIKAGKRTSGASTITMQVARLLEPKKRSYLNKLIEMFRALQLEFHHSKDEILQLYFNLVPYGGNIEGIKSASVIYFGKMPNHLSIAEIATLSIIPNRPTSLRPGKDNDIIIQERNRWIKYYQKAGLFSEQLIQDALKEPFEAHRREIPREAPHIAYRLKAEFSIRKIIYSTIDLEMQKKIQDIVQNYNQYLYYQNIKNATAIVIENRTRKVRAYIGSADFYNDADGGQVDGIKAIRSPGSTLKPLLYGIVIDKGIVTPKSIIEDVKISFGGYEPENYDGELKGKVTVEYALSNSLNIPAVKLLSDIQPITLIETLETINFQQIKNDKNHLGLSLILGGCGATLEELSSLYASFANKGVYSNLSYIKQPKNKKYETRILSKGASFIITDILSSRNRPDLPISWASSPHIPKIAWKTGTSYGRRDAWSIGYNNKYTVGVWVGNFSGEGVPGLSGAEKATPLLFKVFNAIDYNSFEEWFTMPNDVNIRYVCPETGRPPNDFCKNHIMDYFLPGISKTEKCNHLKQVLLSPDSSICYCTSCKPNIGYIIALYPNYSPALINHFNENNIPFKKLPPHNAKCERLLSGLAPKITSPINENEYFVDAVDSTEIMLSCNAANDVSKVYWYINKRFLKSVDANEKLFYTPESGRIEISCSDDKGRNSTIHINVKYIEDLQ